MEAYGFADVTGALAEHGWLLMWFVFVVAILVALHEHGDLSEKIKSSVGVEQAKARRRRILLWLVPVLSVVAAVGSQVATDKLEATIGSLTTNENGMSNELAQARSDRRITDKQRSDFMKALGNSPRGPVMLGVRHPDQETLQYVDQVKGLLIGAGFTLAALANYRDNLSTFVPGSEINLRVDAYDDAPRYCGDLNRAFYAAGMVVSWETNRPGRVYSETEGHPGPGEVLVLVGEKPVISGRANNGP
jgi:hypothetical protein